MALYPDNGSQLKRIQLRFRRRSERIGTSCQPMGLDNFHVVSFHYVIRPPGVHCHEFGAWVLRLSQKQLATWQGSIWNASMGFIRCGTEFSILGTQT